MTGALRPMNAAGTIVRTVKTSRNGRRRPPRSLRAPSGGETRALIATETTMQIVWTSWPRSWPNCSGSVSQRPIAVETTA